MKDICSVDPRKLLSESVKSYEPRKNLLNFTQYTGLLTTAGKFGALRIQEGKLQLFDEGVVDHGKG